MTALFPYIAFENSKEALAYYEKYLVQLTLNV